MKVLFIDDDPISHLINKKFFSLLISDSELEIITFPRADEALEYILQHLKTSSSEILHIFLDLNIPKFSGWDFLLYLEGINDKLLNIYILTSSVSKTDRLRAQRNYLVKGYFIKPLSLPLLKNIVSEQILCMTEK